MSEEDKAVLGKALYQIIKTHNGTKPADVASFVQNFVPGDYDSKKKPVSLAKQDAWKVLTQGENCVIRDLFGKQVIFPKFTGGWDKAYPALQLYLKAQGYDLPDYVDLDNKPIKGAPGAPNADKTRWDPTFRYFYESHVTPKLNERKKR